MARWTPLLLLAPAAAALVSLFVVPMAWLLATSLTGTRQIGAGYARIASDAFYVATLGRTVLLGILVALATATLGTPLAWWLARLPRRRVAPLLALATMPLWTSTVVRSFAWVVLLGRQGMVSRALLGLDLPAPRLLQTLPAVVVALTQVLLPFVVLSLYGVVRSIDPRLEQAARVLGATRLRAALAVTLPLLWPAIFSAAALSFVLAVGAFVTPDIIGGARVHVMSVAIYEQMIDLADWPFAAALSMVLMIVVLVVLLVQRRLVPRS